MTDITLNDEAASAIVVALLKEDRAFIEVHVIEPRIHKEDFALGCARIAAIDVLLEYYGAKP